MTLILLVAETLYLYLPAYVANAAPVLLGGGRPLDGGRRWIDGRPLLGSHKTIRGLASALILGTLTGVAQASPLLGLLQSLGAVLGDLSSSFLKRRLGLKPGALLLPLDQLSFIITAILLSYPLLRPTTSQVLIVLALTLLIHPLTNFIAYLLGLKKEPW